LWIRQSGGLGEGCYLDRREMQSLWAKERAPTCVR
jgi:hypothetical protein